MFFLLDTQNRNMIGMQQQYINNDNIKKIPEAIEFQRPPSTNTPHMIQQQFSNSDNQSVKDLLISTSRSPGASNSSFHEDSMMSSPNSSMQASSPRHHLTYSSVNLNNSSSLLNTSLNHNSKDNNIDIFQKLLELGNEPDRKLFVDRLQLVWEENNIQCKNLPNISKHPLDLYKLYGSVRDKGGFNEVTKLKFWKEISSLLNIANSASAAFNLKKKYVQLGIFHYECKYDRDNIDPIPFINEMEKSNKKTTTKSGIVLYLIIFFNYNYSKIMFFRKTGKDTKKIKE